MNTKIEAGKRKRVHAVRIRTKDSGEILATERISGLETVIHNEKARKLATDAMPTQFPSSLLVATPWLGYKERYGSGLVSEQAAVEPAKKATRYHSNV